MHSAERLTNDGGRRKAIQWQNKLVNAFNNKLHLFTIVVSTLAIKSNTNRRNSTISQDPITTPQISTMKPPGYLQTQPYFPSSANSISNRLASPTPISSSMSLPPPTSSQSPIHVVMAKRDSAASHHYWRDQDSHILSNIRPSRRPSALLPNGDKISSTKAGTLPLPSCLTDCASTAIILRS